MFPASTSELIVYNRSTRQYDVTDPDTGEIVESFPPKRRFEAFLYLVSLFEPELYKMARKIIDRHPQLERRTWKAVEMLLNKQVQVLTVPVNNVLAKIGSSDGYGNYTVTTVGGYLSCECEDFQSAAAPITDGGARYCKHLLAYRLAQYFEDRF